jgi:formylmethanofuran dehydrogenase subunit E
MKTDPREKIKNMLSDGDLHGLLERAAEIHGHYCPGLAAGVKAAAIGCNRLGLVGSEGMEKVMAVVECNNCFVDGIQAIAGCTLGNNALIYRDLGKTAVTFYRRGEQAGLRLRLLDFQVGQDEEERAEAERLFDKAVKQREELTQEEDRRFTELWQKGSRTLIEQPDEEVFQIEEVDVEEVSYAPIFESATCSVCGEDVMETRARLRDGKPVCLPCADERHRLVHGAGIALSR